MGDLLEKVRKLVVRGLNDFSMIENGDRIMVGVSGGKDSALLLLLLDAIRQRSERHFTVEGVMLDQKQPGFNPKAFAKWAETLGLPLTIITEDTYSIVKEKIPEGKTTCGLCSRLRRGILYNHAVRHGFSKLALGHHRDDINATALMNLFYSGTLATMPPKLISDDRRNIVIRPLCYVAESHLQHLAKDLNIPTIPCNLCGSQDGLRRVRIKRLLHELRQETPDVDNTILGALGNVHISHLLDHNLYNFKNLTSSLQARLDSANTPLNSDDLPHRHDKDQGEQSPSTTFV